MKKTFYTLLALAAFAVNANAQTTQRLPNGVQCQVIKQNPGEKIKQSDVVTFNVEQRTESDSLLFSSFKMGQAVKVQIQPSRNVGDLMDVMPLLTAGDSAIVKVPVDSIFKGHEDQRPAFLKAGGNIVYKVKVEKVQTIAEAIAERNAAMAKVKAQETMLAEAYVKEHKLVMKTTPSGLRYVITQQGKGVKPLSGDSVKVNYAGRTLDGKLFDTSIKSVAAAAGVENPNRPYEPIAFPVGMSKVIRGWDEGLLLLNEGTKATFIIPSALGYGEQGSGPGIPPFSTLVFDVELVKVTPAKRLASKATRVTAKKGRGAVTKKRNAVKKKN
ncbi:peptidylprolyl isomerase [Mucilaginibacter sp. PAMC 26640]|nr:peptidylprolyl isomerase [Mucilaginibacter sp. PAMC 26640]